MQKDIALEVRRDEDGTWEASNHVFTAEELMTVDRAAARGSAPGLVRVGGAARKLTVYLGDDRNGYVLLADAYTA